MSRRRATLMLVFSLLAPLAAADQPPWVVRGLDAMVASDSPEASLFGAQIIADGGNAFDAAIVTSLCLAVSRPESTGLGGGGFMVAYVKAEDRFFVLDYRETAPAAATAKRYEKLLAERGDGPSPTVYGGNAVGVPGTLAGIREMHRRWCTLTWDELGRYPYLLARGFVADEHYLKACRDALADYEKWPQLKSTCSRLYNSLLGKGTLPKAGDRVARPGLAQAFAALAEQGPDAMYHGPLGEAVVEAVRAAGGEMTLQDLAEYEVLERDPLRGTYRGYDIVTMPPPSSGGICILQTLNILQAASLRSDLDPKSTRPHVFVEALKHAFADRAHWLGDPDYVELPVARLTSPKYASELAQRIKPQQTLPSKEYGSGAPPAEDRGTSHFCVCDKQGNIVAITETINGTFGSLVVAEPYDIILNNQMDDFAATPGRPNLYGLVQSRANAIAPGKRPLSSMSPTLVFKDKKPVLALGASGGPRIITAVLQVLLAMVDDGKSLGDAIDAPRLHHQWLPDFVYFDKEPPAELVLQLKAAGHQVGDERKEAAVQAIQWTADGVLGASDPRKGGRPTPVLR